MSFIKVIDTTSYTMQQHLADQNAHPQYVKNDATVIAAILDDYLEDNPIQVSGTLDQLSNVTITSVANGDLLAYDSASGMWVNKATSTLGIQSVTVNGASVVDGNKNAVIPNATTAVYGAVRFATDAEVTAGSSTAVAVSPANVSSMIASYKTTATGSMSITLASRNSDGIIAAGGQWQIDNGAWNNSGAVVYNIAQGSHTINFKAVSGYTTPTSLTVNVIGGAILSFTQEYLPTTGTVTVVISNDTTNGRWYTDTDSTERASGTSLSLATGAHKIYLKDLTAYNTAEAIPFAITGGENLGITATYPAISAEVTATIVNITSSTTPHWRLDTDASGTYPHASGEVVKGVTGTRTISFESITGYVTPHDQTITVTKDAKIFVVASYQESDEMIYGVRYFKGTGHPQPILNGIIMDRHTGMKHIMSHTEAWPCLPAHDFKKCIVDTNARPSLARSTAYLVGNIVTLENQYLTALNAVLKCTTAGTTSATLPTIASSIAIGSTIVDGTVTWTVVTDNRVNYYLYASDSTKKADGTTASVLTGADGEVMVQYDPVYFRVEYVGIDSTTSCEIYDWLISKKPFQGAVLHPFFYVHPDSTHAGEPHTQFLGAYESVLAELSNGIKGNAVSLNKWAVRKSSTAYSVDQWAISNNTVFTSIGAALRCTTAGTTASSFTVPSSVAIGDTITDGTVVWTVTAASSALSPNAYTAGSRCCRSIRGAKPVTNMTLAQFRDAYQAAGLHTMNSLAMQFLALMMFIEYRTLDSQEGTLYDESWQKIDMTDIQRGAAGNRSDGFVWYNSSFAYMYVRDAGRADYFGNGTGEVVYSSSVDTDLPDNFASGATGGKKVVGFTYRGLENPFGHIFKFEDGILTDSTGYYWTNQANLYTSDLDTAKTTYNTVAHTWPSSGYIKFFSMSQEEPTFFATEVGGSSTTYLPDYFYNFRYHFPEQIPANVMGRGDGDCPMSEPSMTGIGKIEELGLGTQSGLAKGSRSAFSMPYSE